MSTDPGSLDLAVADDAPVATQEARDQLFERLRKSPVTLAATRDTEGRIRIRPLTTLEADPQGRLTFFVPIDGGIAHDVQAHGDIVLTYSEPGDNAYVVLEGRASVGRDEDKARELWNVFAGAWFTGGPTDPRVGVLRVVLDRGEAWEPADGKVFQFLKMAKAALTKTPPDLERDHHVFRFGT